MALQAQAAIEQKFKETFNQFHLWIEALGKMSKKCMTIESIAWVSDPKKVDGLIEVWWFIYTSDIELLKN